MTGAAVTRCRQARRCPPTAECARTMGVATARRSSLEASSTTMKSHVGHGRSLQGGEAPREEPALWSVVNGNDDGERHWRRSGSAHRLS